ncbi:VPS16 (YPL045W) [Zygosaccharomyces parabailii]|nr:VPS16 (YPL045W) [Zygosaccharomyces parabailii]CDH14119.1 related to Vacuolar protein sorting-associated protein 16 [Zygosaccharomyces bailii ISA1307]
MRNPSFNWEKLDSIFYRSREFCNLEWPQQEDFIYCISTTLLAIAVDETIEIYNYFGEPLAGWNCKQFGKVVKIEFNALEQLIVVSSTSIFLITSWSPLEYTTTSLDEELQDSIWDYKSGAILLRRTQDVYIFNNESIKLVQQNEGKFTLLTKEHWDCNGNKVILLDVNHVYQLNLRRKSLTQWMPDSQWHRCTISTEDEICLYNAKSNKVHVYKESKKPILEVSMDEDPTAINWCGDGVLACSFADEIKLYGPKNTYVSFWYPSEITALKKELDGLKVFTTDKVHFISEVSECTSNIFRVGSTESGAILFDSLQLLETQTSRALENLNAINLEKAVTDCINAAQEEFDAQLQKRLLSAASFGKASLPYKKFDSGVFVQACDTVRLLNFLKTMGIFITKREYVNISFRGIIRNLLMCQKHYHCILLCQILKKNDELLDVFAHWAVSKIKSSSELEDDELSKIIKERYSELPKAGNPPMAKVAHSAFLEGRFQLARDLALLESSPELKTLELLKLDDHALALSECLKFGCPELTLSVLLTMRQKLTTAQLAKLLILDMPQDQLYPYFQRDNHEFLYDYFHQTDNFIDLAHLLLVQGEENHSLNTFLPQIQELYGKVLNDSLIKQDREILNRNAKLWSYQETLNKKYHHNFTGLKLDQTLAYLIEIKQESGLESFLKEFKISERKFYHIKCRTLVKTKSFDDLYEFAISKKSPIGYHAFYNYLKRNSYDKEAAAYISMISGISYEDRKRMYLDCKSYQNAIQLAGKEKDVHGLKELYTIVPTNETQLRALIMDTISKI